MLKINIGMHQRYIPRWRRVKWKNMNYPSPHYTFDKRPGNIDIEYDLTSMEPFPFKDNEVDLYYCSHTFEHIPFYCAQYAANEIYRTLKPGGYVRLITPRIDKDTTENYGKPYDHNDNGRHISYYTEEILVLMLKEAGFKDAYESKPQESKCEEMRGELFDNMIYPEDKPSISAHAEARK